MTGCSTIDSTGRICMIRRNPIHMIHLSKPLHPRFILLGLAVLMVSPGGALAENWPQWRGPLFNGSTTESNLPVEFSVSDKMVWSAPLPGPSAGTTVVWGDRVFVAAVDKTAKEVLALGLDAGSGRELWRHTLSRDRNTAGSNDMGSPSPVTDGGRVWFLTGNGVLAGFTKDGVELWRRDLGKDYGTFVIQFGYSSSPLLFDGKLYVLALQNADPHKGGLNPQLSGPLDSYLLALDPATGATLWKHVRTTDATDQSREAYNTPYPLVWKGRREIVLAGGECVTGHDPATGTELWRWWFTPPDREKLQHVVPTPVAEDGLMYVVRPEHRPLFALRAGGNGTLAKDAVAWTFEPNQSWIASPLVYQGRLYVLQEKQRSLVCLDPQTGRVIWDHKLPAKASLQASPTGADGKIYLLSMTGEVIVLAAGDEYRELACNHLEESQCRSTIVAANGRLFVRGEKQLYCFANPRR